MPTSRWRSRLGACLNALTLLIGCAAAATCCRQRGQAWNSSALQRFGPGAGLLIYADGRIDWIGLQPIRACARYGWAGCWRLPAAAVYFGMLLLFGFVPGISGRRSAT